MRTFEAVPFVATSPRTGNERPSVLRGKNLIFRGSEQTGYYYEVFAGLKDMGENIADAALTGTLSLTSGSTTVSGTGTAFLTELHIGQFVLAGSSLLVVDDILSDTSFLSGRPAAATQSGQTGYRAGVIFPLNKRRGTLLRGNAFEFDKGTILAVGDGTLRVNGAALSGTSLTAARQPKIALYDSGTGNYSVFTLGMNQPTVPALADVAGGVKNMTAGNYSVRIAPFSSGANATGNSSENVTVTLTSGHKVEITFPAMDTAHGQDGWKLYVTLYGSDQSVQGPWYYHSTVTSADLGGTGAGTTWEIEWLNNEVIGNDLLEFNNNPPPDTEFIAVVDGNPVYVSCDGKGSTSPGPVIFPAKPGNLAAAPVELRATISPPESIVGQVIGQARLFLMTPNALALAQATGRDDLPITTRPYWQTGFRNPYALIFINGRLMGFPVSGPTQSIADGDTVEEEHSFAAAIIELTRLWYAGGVLVAHDPANELVCFFHAADAVNGSGYYTTVCLPYSLRHNCWSVPIEFSSTTGDMIVSGAATVNGRLYVLCGGRQAAGGRTWRTYLFDETPASGTVDWYLAWQYQDDGAELQRKRISAVRVNGRYASATVGIHGCEPGQTFDLTTLTAGNSGSVSGAISLPDTSEVSLGERLELNLPELGSYTVRVDGIWDRSGTRHRIDEVALEVTPRAGRY